MTAVISSRLVCKNNVTIQAALQILICRTVVNSLLQRRTTRGLPLVATFASKSRLSGDHEVVDEEVAIRMYFTGAVWILSCDTRIPLQRNNAYKRRETLERATSSSTATAVPLPRWGRLINSNLQIFENDHKKMTHVGHFFISEIGGIFRACGGHVLKISFKAKLLCYREHGIVLKGRYSATEIFVLRFAALLAFFYVKVGCILTHKA